jgi:hypothetical protein
MAGRSSGEEQVADGAQLVCWRSMVRERRNKTSLIPWDGEKA